MSEAEQPVDLYFVVRVAKESDLKALRAAAAADWDVACFVDQPAPSGGWLYDVSCGSASLPAVMTLFNTSGLVLEWELRSLLLAGEGEGCWLAVDPATGRQRPSDGQP